MAPAQQGFRADDGAAGHVEGGLELQHEFIPAQGGAQVLFQAGPFDDLRMHVRIEKLEIVAPAFFRVVHGDIGVVQQRVDGVAIAGKDGHADRGRHLQLVVAQLIGLRDGLQQAGRHVRRLVDAAHFGQDDDEFVAAVAADRVDAAHAAHQAPRHFLEQQIAHVMAHAVIDVLEMVEIQVQDGQHAQLAPRRRQRLRQPVQQQHPVRQVGEEIVLGQVPRVFLALLALADVAEDGHVIAQLALAVADGRQRQPGRIAPARLALANDIALPIAVGVDLLPHVLDKRRRVRLRAVRHEGLAQHVVRTVAADLAVGGIHADDALLRIHHDDGDAGMFDDLRRQVQGPLGQFAGGNIADHGIEQMTMVERDGSEQHFAPEQFSQASLIAPVMAAIAVGMRLRGQLRAAQ